MHGGLYVRNPNAKVRLVVVITWARLQCVSLLCIPECRWHCNLKVPKRDL